MRARNIKPGFFKNDCLCSLSIHARYLFAGLWCLADREGRLEDRPQKIKAEIFPYDKVDIEKLLGELAKNNGDHPFILRYQVEGKRYIQVVNFKKHQNPHRNERPSIIPSPPEEALQEMKETFEKRPAPVEEKELQKTDLSHTKDIPKSDLGHTQGLPWSYQGRTLSRTNRADSLILRFSDSHDSHDSLIADSLKEASPNGEAQRPLRAPPPQGGEKRTPKTAQLEEALSEVAPPAGEPSSAPSPRKEKAFSEVPPQDEDAPLSGPLLQEKKAPWEVVPPGRVPLRGVSLPPEDSSLSAPPSQLEEVSLEVLPLQEDASGTSPSERGSPGGPIEASEGMEFPSSAESERRWKTAPHSEEVPLELPSPQFAGSGQKNGVNQKAGPAQPANYPQPAGSQERESPVPPVQVLHPVKAERSLRSPPQSGRARGSMRSPPHPAVEAYKKAFFCYPRRNLYSLIIEKVGEDEENLRLWAKACQSWAAHGWNPRNIAGLLEYYEKRGFEERSTISRGIPKFSRAAQMAIELAEKYEREEGNEEDQGEKEDISLEEGDQGISAFFKTGAPSPFSHPP